ncbi:MAG: hypothetical protein HY922_00095 [Elusimicrobia bacterium]|nr:hypothetical protein [Elusimicrobiota bacterium]
MKASQGLKPQDVLILLKITTLGGQPWRAMDLAQKLGISASEVSMALERARRVGMLGPDKRMVRRGALLEFLLHGLKYVFPAEPGPLCRGIPTAHSAPALAHRIALQEHDRFVWPSDKGHARGQAVAPLYPSVPHAVMKNPRLYELLALVDALRIGPAAESNIAGQELERRLGGP